MIRKKTSLFFLVLANIIILAHVFIPHHHHGEHLCLGNTDCHSHTAACQHEETGNGHHHDGKTSDDCCQLKHIKALPANVSRQELITRNITMLSFEGFDILVTELGSESLVPVFNLENSLLPDVTGIKPSFLTNTHGLRAPPAA